MTGQAGSAVGRRDAIPPGAALIVVGSGLAFGLLVVHALGGAGHGFARALGPRLFLTLLECVLILPGLAAVALAGLPLARALALRAVSAGTATRSLAAGAALWLGGLGLMQAQSTLLPPSAEDVQTSRALFQILTPSSPLDALGAIATVSLVPALTEEVLVRGILLPSFLALGAPLAVAGSALIFGLMHLDWNRLLFTTGLGVGLGFLRVRTGSLYPPIVAHAAVNGITFALVMLARPGLDHASEARPSLAAGLVMAAIGGYVAFRIIRTLKPASEPAQLAPEAPAAAPIDRPAAEPRDDGRRGGSDPC